MAAMTELIANAVCVCKPCPERALRAAEFFLRNQVLSWVDVWPLMVCSVLIGVNDVIALDVVPKSQAIMEGKPSPIRSRWNRVARPLGLS
jgi:hypothetical protein